MALALASVLLFCSAGVALATDGLGVPTAAQLTAAADQQICGCGFPDLGSLTTDDLAALPTDATLDSVALTNPLCGVCGAIPDCACTDTLTTIAGPRVNLGCPLVTVFPVPVNLVSPTIAPTFVPINVAPQVCLGLPQVNTRLNCFDIACPTVTNINSCPPCGSDC